MSSQVMLDSAGRRRSPATLPGYHAGRAPRNKGRSYPRVEEIIAVTRQAGENVHGDRLRGLIVVLWRAGLRIHEALGLAEPDLDRRRGALLVRHGKGASAARSGWTTGAGSTCTAGLIIARNGAEIISAAPASQPMRERPPAVPGCRRSRLAGAPTC